MLSVTGRKVLIVRCIRTRIHLLLLLKVVVVVLLNTGFSFPIGSSRGYDCLVGNLLPMITVAIVLNINIVVNIV